MDYKRTIRIWATIILSCLLWLGMMAIPAVIFIGGVIGILWLFSIIL